MKLKTREMVIFAMLGAAMYASKVAMDFLPNIHLLGALIVAFTVTYRTKALYPIYVFVFLTGLLNGFGMWWIPYLYIWTVLWGMTMLIPQGISNAWKPFVYMLVSGLHGLSYGILYAPAQALMYGLSFKGMIAWIAAGIPFDITHGISNFICGFMIVPLIYVLRLAEKQVKDF